MYLLSQLLLFLALAGVMGFFLGWWFGQCRCNGEALIAERDAAIAERDHARRDRHDLSLELQAVGARYISAERLIVDLARRDGAAKPAAAFAYGVADSPLAAMSAADLEREVLAAGDGARPIGLAAPQNGKADDLKEIGGVGPKNEAWLHQQGIFHFWQIAEMDVRHLAWLAAHLPNFGQRVYRENWVEQAVRLARGEMTEARRRYQEGEHT
jgi:predicted flap endonuclease-1-like 5' DNA nuclease